VIIGVTFVPGIAHRIHDRGGMEITRTDHIIVGVDGSASSVEALRYAAPLADALNRTLHVVTTWTAPPVDPYAALEWSPEQDAEEILSESIRKAFGGRPPAGLTQRALLGTPARTLIGLSENCYMLVLGSRGHGGFAGLLLGSVSAACAEHAHCPVLIVHTPKTAGADGDDALL